MYVRFNTYRYRPLAWWKAKETAFADVTEISRIRSRSDLVVACPFALSELPTKHYSSFIPSFRYLQRPFLLKKTKELVLNSCCSVEQTENQYHVFHELQHWQTGGPAAPTWYLPPGPWCRVQANGSSKIVLFCFNTWTIGSDLTYRLFHSILIFFCRNIWIVLKTPRMFITNANNFPRITCNVEWTTSLWQRKILMM